MDRSAALVAQWTLAGFVHGVLNTDNMNVTGESFDYGPWRFLPTYDPAFVAAYFDHGGLYAFARQPDAVFWNLCRLADALLALSSQPVLEPVLGRFEDRLRRHTQTQMCRRLGLGPGREEPDHALVTSAFAFLAASQIPYERLFFDWFAGEASVARAMEGPHADRYRGVEFDAFRAALGAHDPVDVARLSHPYFADDAPTTMVIEAMEALWAPIAATDDWGPFDAGIAGIRRMGQALDLSPL